MGNGEEGNHIFEDVWTGSVNRFCVAALLIIIVIIVIIIIIVNSN